MRDRTVTYSSDVAFNSLADPTRRAILDLLRKESLPAGRIAQAFPVSRPAISKHLRLLLCARLVRQHRKGRQRFYHLNAAPLKAVDSWLKQYRAFWQASLDALNTVVESEGAKRSSGSRKKKPQTGGRGHGHA